MRKIRDSKREGQQSEGEEEEKGDEARGPQSMSMSSAFSSFKRSTGLWSREPGCLHFLPKATACCSCLALGKLLKLQSLSEPFQEMGGSAPL